MLAHTLGYVVFVLREQITLGMLNKHNGNLGIAKVLTMLYLNLNVPQKRVYLEINRMKRGKPLKLATQIW